VAGGDEGGVAAVVEVFGLVIFSLEGGAGGLVKEGKSVGRKREKDQKTQKTKRKGFKKERGEKRDERDERQGQCVCPDPSVEGDRAVHRCSAKVAKRCKVA